MNGWQAVIFDLDDTLYPEREYALGGMRAVADWARQKLHLPAERTLAELTELFDAGVRGNTFDRWLAAQGLEPRAWVPAMVQAYREHEPRIALYPQARPLLRRLGRRTRLGLVTDGYLDVQRRKVAALGLEAELRAIVYSDQWGRDAWKPSPRPFDEVLRQLQVDPRRSVYVGDNPAKDFRGPRLLGMASIRVRHADGLHRDREPAAAHDAPDAEVPHLGELEAALELATCCRTSA